MYGKKGPARMDGPRAALVAVLVLVGLSAFIWGLRTGLYENGSGAFTQSQAQFKESQPGKGLSSPTAPAPREGLATSIGEKQASKGRTGGSAAQARPAQQPAPGISADQRQAKELKVTLPLEGEVVNAFGWSFSKTYDDWRFHTGLDFVGELGAEVRAAASGRVESVEDSEMHGARIVIDHGSGWKTVYAGCDSVLVKKGDVVKAGTAIARLGRGAFESGDPPHVHFEVWSGGKPVDPAQYLGNLTTPK